MIYQNQLLGAIPNAGENQTIFCAPADSVYMFSSFGDSQPINKNSSIVLNSYKMLFKGFKGARIGVSNTKFSYVQIQFPGMDYLGKDFITLPYDQSENWIDVNAFFKRTDLLPAENYPLFKQDVGAFNFKFDSRNIQDLYYTEQFYIQVLLDITGVTV